MKWIQLGVMMVAAGVGWAANAQTNNHAVAGLGGTILDERDQPVAGALVEGFPGGKPPKAGAETNIVCALSDAKGVFELPAFSNRSKQLTLVVQKAGLGTAWKILSAPKATNLEIVLSAPGPLGGRVVDESGTPVAGARVSVVKAIRETMQHTEHTPERTLNEGLARRAFSTRTGPDGRFAFTNFPANASADVLAEAEGQLSLSPEAEGADKTLPFEGSNSSIELKLVRLGAIEGKIVFDSKVQPLPVARLQLSRVSEKSGIQLFTNGSSSAEGKFSFPGLPPGTYRLLGQFGANASSSEWVAETITAEVVPAHTNSAVQLKAFRGGLLRVTVSGETNARVLAKMSVSAYKEEYQINAKPDTNGVALLRLPAGAYQLMALSEGAPVSRAQVSVEALQTNSLELAVAQPQRLSGLVHYADGKPAGGVEYRVVSGRGEFDPRPALTDAEGRFSLQRRLVVNEDQPGGQWVPCVLVRDVARNLAVAQELDVDTTNLDLQLQPGLSLTGKAVCQGKVLTNCTVALIFWSGQVGMHLADVGTQWAQGGFEIPALPQGRRYGIVVGAEGFGQATRFNLEIADDTNRVELETFELQPANLKLAGVVLDENDQPVADAGIYVQGEGQRNTSVRSDRHGRFEVSQVCEGSIRLYVSAKNQSGSVSADAGDTNVVVHLGTQVSGISDSATHKLSGRVLEPDGKPASQAWIRVFSRRSQPWVKTDTNGAFRLSWSQVGDESTVTIAARLPGRSLAGLQEWTEDGTNLDLKLQPALTVRGLVKNASGTNLVGATIQLWLQEGAAMLPWNEPAAQTDGTGRFVLDGVPAEGAFALRVSAKGHGQIRQTLVHAAETNLVELDPFVLPIANRVLAGQVLTPKEKPAAGIEVSLLGENQPAEMVATDHEGRFHFAVCEGQLQLFAHSSGALFANAVAQAGDTNVLIQLLDNSGRAAFASSAARLSLKGSPLPDLTFFGLETNCLPAGRRVLLCLFDSEQRPSRHVMHQLAEQAEALKQKGLGLLGIQAAVSTPATLKPWLDSSGVTFPVGCLTNATSATSWVTKTKSLPWLILTDSHHLVVAEGFDVEELDAQLK